MAVQVNIPELSVAYRKLVLWVGTQLVIGVILRVLLRSVQPPLAVIVALATLIFALTSAAALAIYAYRTAKALGSFVGVLWGLAMVVPLVNLATLLLLSSKATRACRAAGVRVGFLGPKPPFTADERAAVSNAG